jgi:colanic acid biosynthesis protein WcaH
MTATLPLRFLSHAEVDTVIRLAPLIAIDLIIRSARDEVLLGLRKNEPAKGCYFVPGGMILKNERLADRSGNGGYGTHYVVLGYELRWPSTAVPRPDDQHSELRWWSVPELLASDRVHENAKAYFRPSGRQSHARV